MALILRKSVFIHVAKTGGTWVSELLKQSGLVVGETRDPHASLAETVLEIPTAGSLPSFAFVRHPITWWKSYWSYKVKVGWDPKNRVDSTCTADKFETFIRNVLDRHPGYLSRRYWEMTQGVTFIGRFEALRESLMEILLKIGEEIPKTLYDKGDSNVASKEPQFEKQCRLSPELLNELIQKEGYAFRHFGYGLERRSSRPPTIWITGLSSSGKTALARALSKILDRLAIQNQVLDGDELRRTITAGLDFSEEGRRKQALRTAHMAAILSKNGILPIVALVSPYRAHRAEAREIASPTIEVYMRCPLEVCEARNTNGLYRKARSGEISGVAGLDVHYQEPISPDVIIHSDRSSVLSGAEDVLKVLLKKWELS